MNRFTKIFALICLYPAGLWAQCNSPCVASASCIGGAGGSVCTTGTANTTGANFVVFEITFLDTTGSNSCGVSVSDNKSNGAPTTLTEQSSSAATSGIIIGYWTNPTVGSGHTWSTAASGCSGNADPTLMVMAFSGMATSTPLEAGSSVGTFSNAGPTSLAAGSFTPTQNCDVTVAGFGYGNSVTGNVTISNSMKILATQLATATSFGSSFAYVKQTGMSAINPTWSWNGASTAVVAAATFKSASTSCAATSGKGQMMLVGVGK